MKKIIFILLVAVLLVISGCSILGKVVEPTKQIKNVGTEECSNCKSKNDCTGFCDSQCVRFGYEGEEGSTGYEESKYLGLDKDVICTCRCYYWS